MVTEIKLGLCNPPEPIYLYVKNAELGGESYLCYNYNIDRDKTIPVLQKALTGYLSELRLTTKEFKGKDNLKLDIVVSADGLYVIRSGIEINFTKSFLLAASGVQYFSRPLIIAATAGGREVGMTQQITPQDTQKVLDLCSGIGGFTLGHLISGGFQTVAFCEINSYCQQLLSLRFPHIPIIPDIHDITTESLCRVGVGEIDGIIVGLPCPPFSIAGKRQASQDSRNLFGEFFRILRQIRPQWAIVENVPGLLVAESGQFLRTVLWQFASLGFDVEWGVFSAASVGAVHLRERIWIIAYSQSGMALRKAINYAA